jgi:hypothetical protein
MKFTSFAPLGLLVSMTAAAPALTPEKIDSLAALAARSGESTPWTSSSRILMV